jgi:hypothetical protein
VVSFEERIPPDRLPEEPLVFNHGDDALVYHDTGKSTMIRIEIDTGKVKGFIDKLRDKFSERAQNQPGTVLR